MATAHCGVGPDGESRTGVASMPCFIISLGTEKERPSERFFYGRFQIFVTLPNPTNKPTL